VVADDGGADLPECHVAEDMVGVHVGVDQVADRLGAYLADRGDEGVRLDQAAAAVDDGDGVGADDDAEVGDRALVGGAHQFIDALESEDAVGDFPELEFKSVGCGESGPPQATGQHRGADRGAGEAVHKLASCPVDRHGFSRL
jgi:hypothetical protein